MPAVAGAQDAVGDDEFVQALDMPAPFECGTFWRGSTYSGHGSNNWNLDVNTAHGFDDHGSPLYAQHDGTVVWFKPNGYNNRAGTYIEIDYGDVTARYMHLVSDSIPAEIAAVGATVEQGDLIGLLGNTGRSSGPHLHLEYWDSSGLDNTPWYQLPRDRHIPVAFDGELMIATPGNPTADFISNNCEGDALPEELRAVSERISRLAR